MGGWQGLGPFLFNFFEENFNKRLDFENFL